jgi:hypothetical protein
VAARESKYRSARTCLVRGLGELYSGLQDMEATIGFLTEVYAEGGELGILATTRARIREATLPPLPARCPAATILAQYRTYPYTRSLY